MFYCPLNFPLAITPIDIHIKREKGRKLTLKISSEKEKKRSNHQRQTEKKKNRSRNNNDTIFYRSQ